MGNRKSYFFHLLVKNHLDIMKKKFSMSFQLHLLYHTLSIIPLISFISLWLFFFFLSLSNSHFHNDLEKKKKGKAALKSPSRRGLHTRPVSYITLHNHPINNTFFLNVATPFYSPITAPSRNIAHVGRLCSCASALMAMWDRIAT